MIIKVLKSRGGMRAKKKLGKKEEEEEHNSYYDKVT